MKKIFAWILCLALLGAWMLPVAATEPSAPTATSDVPQPVQGASDVMAVVCLVIVLAAGAYLFFMLKRKH